VPAATRSDPELRDLYAEAASRLRPIHLVYAPRWAEAATKTYDYSRASLQERWAAGRQEMAQVLDEVAALPPVPSGVVVHRFPKAAAPC
jgi:hypothetical protein